MDRALRRHRTEQKVRRREELARARGAKVKKRGKLRRHAPELYRCDCEGCQAARMGELKPFPADLTDA